MEIHNIIAFNFINDPKILLQIAQSKFKRVVEFLKEKYEVDIIVEAKNKVWEIIIKPQAASKNGGRGLLNEIEEQIINPLANLIFENKGNLIGKI